QESSGHKGALERLRLRRRYRANEIGDVRGRDPTSAHDLNRYISTQLISARREWPICTKPDSRSVLREAQLRAILEVRGPVYRKIIHRELRASLDEVNP